jgi:multicomponent Na+:H+ antiporter subunit E
MVMIMLVLALLWAVMTGNFSGLNLLFGAVIGAGAMLLLRGRGQPRALRRIGQVVLLTLLFLRELMLSAVRVARVVLSPNLRAQIAPQVVAFPLSVKTDAEITLLANLITLTPGTLSIDVSEDRSTLFVHALDASSPQAVIADIATGFEARIRELSL